MPRQPRSAAQARDSVRARTLALTGRRGRAIARFYIRNRDGWEWAVSITEGDVTTYYSAATHVVVDRAGGWWLAHWVPAWTEAGVVAWLHLVGYEVEELQPSLALVRR